MIETSEREENENIINATIGGRRSSDIDKTISIDLAHRIKTMRLARIYSFTVFGEGEEEMKLKKLWRLYNYDK